MVPEDSGYREVEMAKFQRFRTTQSQRIQEHLKVYTQKVQKSNTHEPTVEQASDLWTFGLSDLWTRGSCGLVDILLISLLTRIVHMISGTCSNIISARAILVLPVQTRLRSLATLL